MRTLQFLFIAIVLLICHVGFSACNKDNSNGNNQAGSGTITAKIDGVSFSSNASYCTFVGGTMNLGLISQNNGQLQLNNVTATTGTYDLSDTDYIVILKTSSGETISALSGSVTVTSFTSSKVKGTFQGSFTDFSGGTHAVTNGTFEGNF